MLPLLAATTLICGNAAAQPAMPDPAHLQFKLPKDIPWRSASGGIAETASLFGGAGQPGPYATAVHYFPGKFSEAHTHNHDRHIYVVSGTWWVGTSDKVDPDKAMPIPAGSYVKHVAGKIHWDGAKNEDVRLVIFGIGQANTGGGR
jgi:quercetin dioxygenase-like cupin family protein